MRRARPLFFVIPIVALLLLFGVPWWTIVASDSWPTAAFAVGTVVFAAGIVGFPLAMWRGHRHGGSDALARTADTTLGVIWILFAWSVLGLIVRLVLALSGVDNPLRDRITALAALAVGVVLAVYGNREAMRVPRIRAVDVVIPRLGKGLDGLRVVVLADTHYGPINRLGWSQRLAAAVNELKPDVVCHAGDLADGTVEQRRAQVDPLGDIVANEAKLYITGNHEYFSEAQNWLDHMGSLGWDPLHNRNHTIERGGDTIVFAGIDDRTAASSGQAGHGADLAAALADTGSDVPIVLLAHQPKEVSTAAAGGVDLQISGHTHGGQIWPFHLIVRLEQGNLQGLSRINDRTQLYTSRGAGFWGPPFRVFAPSEISLLTLRSSDPSR
ncbi:MAG TPA: metallophosphoesterase [Pseudonocardiaceae bacterium]|jgi:hypothetical protein|nr:metallophosphoesterase [Pseudonocardiaceae bacterium]